MKEAILYKSMQDGSARCELCAHRCLIAEGKRGLCALRENVGGKLYALSYDRIAAMHIDPIEKKPLYHFKPGSSSYSIATVGCNFRCTFCQNYEMSQWLRDVGPDAPGQRVTPIKLAAEAKAAGCKSIAFTYTEPTVFAELCYDTAIEARKHDIDCIFVSNGYMTEEMIDAFGPLIAGANIDLKAFSDDTYKRVIGGRLQPVLDSIARLRDNDSWVEVTTLVVPGMNDSDKELGEIAGFISSIGTDIPWHISAFHPTYKMTDRKRTELGVLHRAYEIGRKAGLKFVYTGNVMDELGSTICPACGETVIGRRGFRITTMNLQNGCCANCGEKIPGRF